jgi:hypothetical protein
MKQGAFELAVVLPLEDPRGDIADHLRTWTHQQTLERERYQVVVAGDGEHPEFERGVEEVLSPQDVMVRVPGASTMGLYAAAAEAANGNVIVLSEAHCLADPGLLLTIADAFAEEADLDGGIIRYLQSPSNPLGELTDRWFDRAFAAWDLAGWPRFNNAGVAIRREAYARAGGLEPTQELYAPSFLSARMHAQGSRVEPLEGAVLTHELEETIAESLIASRSFARGECVTRRDQDTEFCERYFGSAGLWDRRLCYRPEIARSMIAALVSAIRSNPRGPEWLYRELAARVPAGVAGPRPRWIWEAATARLHAAIAEFGSLPAETRWRSYVSAQDRTVRSVQLEESSHPGGLPAPLEPDAGVVGAGRLAEVLVGADALESENGRALRWTEPVVLMRLSVPADGAQLRVETGGLRGRPLDYIHGIYCAGRELPRELISGDDEDFEVRLPAEFARDVAAKGLVILSDPLVPSRAGSSDQRRLGIPVVAVELSTLEQRSEWPDQAAAVSAAPAG